MNKFSKEYLFRECVLHHHCILLRLKHPMKWDNAEVNEIYMTHMCLDEQEQKQMLINIANTYNTFGNIEIKAFARNDAPTNSRLVILSTDDVFEIEKKTV